MDPVLNPYNPGAGLRPPSLAGRQAELRRMETLIQRSRAGLTDRGIILTGLRGVGKTVLLRELRARAQSAGWLVVQLEGVAGESGQRALRSRLGKELVHAARSVAPTSPAHKMAAALGSITSFGVQVGANGAGLTIERAPGRADSGQFDLDFSDLVEDVASAMAEEHRGFALFVDELQDVDHDTLAALVLAQHRAGQEGWPFYLIGAGLPSLQRVLSEARSYAERIFDYYTVGALPAPEAAAALVDPARRFDADYTAEALDAILVAAAGYPYFLQEFGRAIWDRALDNPFSLPDAEQAVDFGQERLDAGFYRSRWDRATRAERDFLRAMVPDDGGPSSSSTVAKRMGRTLSGNGPVRASLIGKGLVYAPEHGQVAYTVPGMHQFIERQHD